VKGPGDKRVVLDTVGEHYQLAAANSFLSFLRQLLDNPAHQGNRIHVDTGTCRGYVYGRTNPLGGRQRIRDGFHQVAVTAGCSFLHQRRITGKVVNTQFTCTMVECSCNLNKCPLIVAVCNYSNRCHGQTFIGDRNPKLTGDCLDRLDMILTGTQQFLSYPGDKSIGIRISAVSK